MENDLPTRDRFFNAKLGVGLVGVRPGMGSGERRVPG